MTEKTPVSFRHGELWAVTALGWVSVDARVELGTIHGLWLCLNGCSPGWLDMWNSGDDMPVGFFRVQQFAPEVEYGNVTFVLGADDDCPTY